MAEIEAKVKIKHVAEWATDWSNEQDKRNELEQLKYDMKMSIKPGMGYTHCCAPVLIHIRYCRWGGHPKDRWMWEGIVARSGDGLEVGHGWDYGRKEQLIERCKELGYDYEVHRYKRNGKIEVVQSS